MLQRTRPVRWARGGQKTPISHLAGQKKPISHASLRASFPLVTSDLAKRYSAILFSPGKAEIVCEIDVF